MFAGRKRKALEAATRRNGQLLGDLMAVGESYADVLAQLDARPGSDAALDDGRAVARMAAGGLLHDWVMLSALDAHDVLPPALDPGPATRAMQSFGESALLLVTDGPASPLVLDAAGAAAMLEEPALASWIELMASDGEPWTEDFITHVDDAPVQAADPHERDELVGALRTLLPRLMQRYPPLYEASANLGPVGPEVSREALELARECATLLRGLALGGDVRRFPEGVVYAAGVLLPRLFQSLTTIAWQEEERIDLLTPLALQALTEDVPYVPALLV